MNVIKYLADYYNFEVAAFYWRDDSFHFRGFLATG